MNLPNFIEHATEHLTEARRMNPLNQMAALAYLQRHMAQLPEVLLLKALDRCAERANSIDDPDLVSTHIERALAALKDYSASRA